MAVPSRPRLSRRAGDSTPNLPFDSFSLREKVAAGRMRVKTLGWFFVKAAVWAPDNQSSKKLTAPVSSEYSAPMMTNPSSRISVSKIPEPCRR